MASHIGLTRNAKHGHPLRAGASKHKNLAHVNHKRHDNAKSNHAKSAVTPVLETTPRATLPGFFEDEDIIARVESGLVQPKKLQYDAGHSRKPSGNVDLEQKLVLDDFVVQELPDTKGHPPHSNHRHHPHKITSPRHKHDLEHARFRDSPVFEEWHGLKERFVESYEMKGGRKLHQGITSSISHCCRDQPNKPVFSIT